MSTATHNLSAFSIYICKKPSLLHSYITEAGYLYVLVISTLEHLGVSVTHSRRRICVLHRNKIQQQIIWLYLVNLRGLQKQDNRPKRKKKPNNLILYDGSLNIHEAPPPRPLAKGHLNTASSNHAASTMVRRSNQEPIS